MIVVGAYPRTTMGHPTRSDLSALGELLSVAFTRDVGVHLLPMWHADGDGGFAVTTWTALDPQYGSEDDIRAISSTRHLMVDGIFNHVAWQHPLAQQFATNPDHMSRLVHAVPADELPLGPRAPRGGNVYRQLRLAGQTWFVWQTFGSEAVDVNLGEPEVLAAVFDGLAKLKALGATSVRLDAVAYYGKHGPTQTHAPDGIKSAQSIMREVDDLGLDTVLQIDCDEDAFLYTTDNTVRPGVIDFSFSTFIVDAYLTGSTRWLASYLSATSAITGVSVHRPIRTHDGILMRSKNQSPPFVQHTEELYQRANLQLRYTNGKVYESNHSLPYVLRMWEDHDAYYRKVIGAAVIGVLTSDVTYIYLNALLGEIPEHHGGTFDTSDPRTLQRRPVTVDFAFNGPWHRNVVARTHLAALARISAKRSGPNAERSVFVVRTIDEHVIDVINPGLALRALVNVSSSYSRSRGPVALARG